MIGRCRTDDGAAVELDSPPVDGVFQFDRAPDVGDVQFAGVGTVLRHRRQHEFAQREAASAPSRSAMSRRCTMSPSVSPTDCRSWMTSASAVVVPQSSSSPVVIVRVMLMGPPVSSSSKRRRFVMLCCISSAVFSLVVHLECTLCFDQ